MPVVGAVDDRSRDRAKEDKVASVRPDEALQRLGGIADVATLLGVTSRARLRKAVDSGLVVREATGRYALPGTDEAVRAAHRLAGILVEDSAAQYYGWEMKHRPSTPCAAVPRKRNVPARLRSGVRVRFLDLDPADINRVATSPGETVMRCAARLPFDEALAIADSGLRRFDVTSPDLVRRAEVMPDRYRSRCLRVAEHADGRAANPFESVLRAIALDVPSLSVEPQVWVEGIGRPDLLDKRRRLVIEADSFEFHGRRKALKSDCERYNAFVTAGWTVLRFSWEHVMFEPDYVRAVLSAVAQPPGQALAPLRIGLSA